MTETQTQLDLPAPVGVSAVTEAESTPTPANTAQLLEALRDHYLMPGQSRPGAVFLTEVTAPDRIHRADAVHVGLWASRGYTVDVCELKTGRADFQRELDQPDKAEAWWAHSNTFWIVAPNTMVAPPQLLPPGWGLMVPGKARRFKVVTPAERRELRPTTALLAALLVSMETDRNKEVERQRNRLVNEHHKQMQALRRQATAPGSAETHRRLKRLEELEKSCGFQLDSYDFGEYVSPEVLGSALRELIAKGRAVKAAAEALERMEDTERLLRSAIADARKAIDAEQSGGAS